MPSDESISICKNTMIAGRDALLWGCALNRSQQVLSLLKEARNDLHYCRRDRYGYSALHYATLHGECDLYTDLYYNATLHSM